MKDAESIESAPFDLLSYSKDLKWVVNLYINMLI
jgi:hypothetical protein